MTVVCDEHQPNRQPPRARCASERGRGGSFQYVGGLVQFCPVVSNFFEEPSCLIGRYAWVRVKGEASIDAARLLASTFSMIKAKFGDPVRSKTDVAMSLRRPLTSRAIPPLGA
jgi:hypothetical protein